MPDLIGLPDLSGKRILVVDDIDDHAELMHAFLRPFRAEVRMVRNVDAALAYLSDAPFDLLISDLAMPGKDGLALIRAIRAWRYDGGSAIVAGSMNVPGRADKTRDKTRRGGLPAPTSDRPTLESGNGQRCDGCGEPITELERMAVVVIFSVALYRFHEDCYTAWSTFTR